MIQSSQIEYIFVPIDMCFGLYEYVYFPTSSNYPDDTFFFFFLVKQTFTLKAGVEDILIARFMFGKLHIKR